MLHYLFEVNEHVLCLLLFRKHTHCSRLLFRNLFGRGFGFFWILFPILARLQEQRICGSSTYCAGSARACGSWYNMIQFWRAVNTKTEQQASEGHAFPSAAQRGGLRRTHWDYPENLLWDAFEGDAELPPSPLHRAPVAAACGPSAIRAPGRGPGTRPLYTPSRSLEERNASGLDGVGLRVAPA